MSKLGNIEHSIEVDGTVVTFHGGKLAQQAGGAVVTSADDDVVVLTTTTASSQPKDFLPFFPLTIDVEERQYAAGKIPGSFFKREGRPGTEAILTCRLTDRPLRPTFAEGLRNEVQVVNTIMQTTQTEPYDVIAMNGASAATMLAGVPFDGPVASLRLALYPDGSWKAFPSFAEMHEEIVFSMVIAGRVDGDEVAILMIEAEASPSAPIKIEMGATAPTEELIGEAIETSKSYIRTLCEAQQAFVDKVGRRDAREFPRFFPYEDEQFDTLWSEVGDDVRGVYEQAELSKQEKDSKLQDIKQAAIDKLVDSAGADAPDADTSKLSKQYSEAFRSAEKKAVRGLMTEKGIRIDGRGPRDLRELEIDVNVLPRTHGTGYFRRGETQAMSVLALGTTRDNQRLDTLDPITEKYFLHHYNFPPYSTGETGRVGSPKRREIGHGALAERAIVPVLPSLEEWPYTMRIVSDILSSNGSTSMASVCGSTLALMDGGVPIHAPVAGIAMGLIKEGDTYTTLTDIQGTEDFFGDMDFKVAGTREFVTALQLDTKLSGIPGDVLAEALLQAKDARLEILDAMEKVIAEPRDEVADSAPRVEIVHIPKDKIGEVIGPKGKIIKEIQEETGAQIDLEEEGGQGVVRIYGDSRESAQAAVDRVNQIANPTIPEVGERYHATIVKTVDFGAFVSLTPGIDGLVHISQLKLLSDGSRLDHAEEAVNVGETLWVEIQDVLDGGRKFKLALVGEDGELLGGNDARGGGGGGGRSDRGGRGGGRSDRGGDRDDRGGNRGGGRGGDRGGRGSDRGGRDDRGGRNRDRDDDRGGRSRDRDGGSDDGGSDDGGSKDGGSRDGGSRDGGSDRPRTRTRTRSRSRSRD